MTTSRLRGIGWAALGFNVVLAGMDVGTGSYTAASIAAIAAVWIAGLLWVGPKMDALFEARIGESQAKRRIADLALHAFEQQIRTGDVRVTVTPAAVRVN